MSTWQDLKDNPRLKKIYKTRCRIIRCIREWFWSQGFLEVQTPLAVRYPGQEPYLNPVPLAFHEPSGAAHNFYLHTSPEYSLKKLLAAGFSKIFEITKTFRDYESFGGNHNPEFTMVEWYRAPGDYTDFMDDLEKMFKHIAKELPIENLIYKNYTIKINQTWGRMTMKEVWEKYTSINLNNNLTIEQLSQTARERGHSVGGSDAYEDVFFKIFLNEIEPKLGLERPLFVYDYPAQMCSLSRASVDPRYAERVECYIGGLELCNGFGELTDANIQKIQLERDKALRVKLGKATWPVDPDFIKALGALPAEALAQAGVALGVDRMVLLFTGAKDINEVMFSSVADQISNEQ